MSSATKRRLLLVTSSYAPVTMADMHRVRHLAWELPKQGWEVEVLAPNAEFQSSEYQDTGFGPHLTPELTFLNAALRDKYIFHYFTRRALGPVPIWPMV